RFTRLEQRNKEKTNFIAKMDDDIKEIKQSSANASSIENSNNVIQTSLRNHDENENNTKTMNIVHDQEKISLEVSVQKMLERLNEDVSQRESDSGLREFINTEFIDREHSNSSPVTEELARLFHQASIARKNSIKAKQEEISSWGRYSERFEDKVMKLRSEDKNLKDKTARSQIYNEMKPYLSGVSDEYLRKITSKVRKINKLFGYDYDPITLKKIK
ncbi:2773_t:CDS:2, partial [Funneliformis geosporum]